MQLFVFEAIKEASRAVKVTFKAVKVTSWVFMVASNPVVGVASRAAVAAFVWVFAGPST